MLEKGIRVNCVAPGPVWTPLIVSSYPEEEINQFESDPPMGRPAQPRELAPAFVFLASGRSSSLVNGEILAVTGDLNISANQLIKHQPNKTFDSHFSLIHFSSFH